MKLIFTGRGAAFNVKEGNTNAYFIENGKLFLIDCGETMFATLIENDIFKGIKEVYVLVSHTHSDHCGSLGSVGLYCQFVLGTKLKIVVPHNDTYVNDLRKLMTIFGNTEKAFEMVYEEEIDDMFEAFDSVRYDLTKHDYMLTCYSFVFETKEGAVFFSADTRVMDNMLRFVDTHDDIKQIFMEGTDLKNANDIHLNIDEMDEKMPKQIKPYVYMMHLRAPSCIEKLRNLGYKIVEVCEETY